MKEGYIIFEVSGDLRKNLMATAVVSSLKKAHPDRKIVVMTTTPEVWLHNPHVHRFYTFGRHAYFYDDYVKDKDTIILRHDPMSTDDFVHHRKHLVEIWCDLCGVPYDGSLPSLHFTWREKEAVSKLTASDKPLFFIQTNAPSVSPRIPEFWATDLPFTIAQKVVDAMNEKGYTTVHIRNEQQPALRNTSTLSFDSRLLLCAMSRSNARLLIDSHALQTATAFGLPSVVVWIASDPLLSGYEMHENTKAALSPEFREQVEGYNEAYILGDAILECPHDRRNIFNPEELVERLLALAEKEKQKS